MIARLTSQRSGVLVAILAFAGFYSLATLGFALAERTSTAIALLVAFAAFEIHAFWEKGVRRRMQWQSFATAMESPGRKPTSLDGNQEGWFFPIWQTMSLVPEALIRMSADGRALQIASVDQKYNVAIPIEMITQVEFDRGDGPPGKRHPGMSQRREWLGIPYAPTVYLGLACTDEDGVFVYPLCFHPEAEQKARELHDRLLASMDTVNRSLRPTLAADVFDEKLPPSFESEYLRPDILRRFWPDYRAKGLRAWLDR